jgi:hypothetical protein
MINYYKFKVSVFRIDTDSKSFTQVNDAEDVSSVGVYTNEKTFDALSKVISDNNQGGWESITEEDFTFVKQKILNELN